MKQFVKSVIARTGFEINRSSQARGNCRDSFEAQHQLLQTANVSRPLIFDIGARYGETTARYLSIFSHPTSYSFEPFPSPFRRIVSRYADVMQSKVRELLDGKGYVPMGKTGLTVLYAENTRLRYSPAGFLII